MTAKIFVLILVSLAAGSGSALAQSTTTWNGSAWSDGHPDANKDVVISSGTFTTSINSNVHCKNLTIDVGATLVVLAGDTFSVSGVVTNEGTLTNNGHLMLRSCGKYSVTDVDGNSYATVQIGRQCWTQSNLRVSKYRDGDNITNITTPNSSWENTTSGAWCNYDNNASNGTTYGKLYNWYAVNDSRGLCPTGWHVPSDAEWTTLTTHLGGTSVSGGKMKSTGTTLWISPNTGATNSSGFTGLPGGLRFNTGGFNSVGVYGLWWSSSDAGSGHAWYRFLTFSNAIVNRTFNVHRLGFSVRCARD